MTPKIAPLSTAAEPTPRARTERIERREGQLNLFKTAPTLYRLDRETPFIRARAAHDAGDAPTAAAAYRQAAASGDRAADAWSNLAVLEWERAYANPAHDRLLALAAASEALLREPAHRAALFNLAVFFVELGEWHAAYVQLRRAHRAGFDHPDLYATLATIAAGVGQIVEADQARLAYARLTDGPPPPDHRAALFVVG